MNGLPPKLNWTAIGMAIALAISLGTGLFNIGGTSRDIAAADDKIAKLEGEMEAERERRVAVTSQLSKIEVKVDLLLADKAERR